LPVLTGTCRIDERTHLDQLPHRAAVQ